MAGRHRRCAVATAASNPHLSAFIWYTDRDVIDDRSSNENFYGIQRPDGTAKPSLAALRDAIGRTGITQLPR